MKIEEVKSMTENELGYELGKLRKELFELRFKARTAGVNDPARMRVLKRSIARMLTVRHQRSQPVTAPAAAQEGSRRPS